VGIGGGIFLSPLLFFLGWANAKEVAASASFFILANSLAGLTGQFAKGGSWFDVAVLLPLALAVFWGGQLGSRLGARKIPLLPLQRVTGALILIAATQILWRQL
jgi:uncharacterized membrane protein YfcA